MLCRTTLACVSVLLVGIVHCHAQEKIGGATPAPIVPAGATIKDNSSYALGFSLGGDLAQGGIGEKDVDTKDLLLGILDAISKKEPKLSQAQFQDAMKAFQQRIQTKMIEAAKLNLEKANAYLEANKKKDGVQTTRTGLQYVILKSGTGKQPTVTDTVVCHYEGKLINGTVFDSSLKRNEPLTIPVSKVVPGWTEALQRMKVGDKWLLTLPPNLAYGEQGSPPVIGPNETLIFEIELLDVKK